MRVFLIVMSLLFGLESGAGVAAETPKRGGTLTFIIPAEAPPSLDGHREGTFATVHMVAPFYSVLMRVDPNNPSDTTRFDCDLCTAIPAPTDDGKTFTFNIREGVKFQDGTGLTAADVAASWRHIIFPPRGVLSARQNYFSMVDDVEAPTATTVVFRLKFATAAFLPALADPFALITPNASRKPFDDVRVRRALLLAIDQWGSSAALSKIAILQTVGGIVFPGSPLAATKEELQQIAGFWPDIEKSRAEARRLLKEAGAEGLTFELLVRNVDQPYKFGAVWAIDQWSKIGVHVSQKVVPTAPWFAAMRAADFSVVLESSCPVVVNPVLDVQKYLPHELFVENYGYYKDPVAVDIYDKMLHETDQAKQRILMRAFEKQVLDVEAHEFPALWWNRIVVHRSYVKGWKISPSHFVNQDLAPVWLDK